MDSGMRMRIGMMLGALVSIGVATACEKTIEPGTGERNLRLAVPMTPEHGERLDQRWQECLRFRSPSVCERRHPGARPTGRSAPTAPAEADVEEPAPAGSEPAVRP
jgi:hypothetical protein